MAIGIKGEGYKVSESQAGQIESAARNVPEEKSASAQEMPVNTNENEQHSKGAREIATSKKADAQLQAMSLQIQLNASSALSEPGNNNVQQLAQPSSDEGRVDSLTKTQNPYESLREKIADERESSENSTTADETRAEPSTESESDPFQLDLKSAIQDYQQASNLLSNTLKQAQQDKEKIIKNSKA